MQVRRFSSLAVRGVMIGCMLAQFILPGLVYAQKAERQREASKPKLPDVSQKGASYMKLGQAVDIEKLIVPTPVTSVKPDLSWLFPGTTLLNEQVNLRVHVDAEQFNEWKSRLEKKLDPVVKARLLVQVAVLALSTYMLLTVYWRREWDQIGHTSFLTFRVIVFKKSIQGVSSVGRWTPTAIS
jgi:hypothetical protein